MLPQTNKTWSKNFLPILRDVSDTCCWDFGAKAIPGHCICQFSGKSCIAGIEMMALSLYLLQLKSVRNGWVRGHYILYCMYFMAFPLHLHSLALLTTLFLESRKFLRSAWFWGRLKVKGISLTPPCTLHYNLPLSARWNPDFRDAMHFWGRTDAFVHCHTSGHHDSHRNFISFVMNSNMVRL